MLLNLHRISVRAEYTLSQVTYAGGEFHLLEPPLFGTGPDTPRGLIPEQKKIFIKIVGGELRPCLPRCGRHYLQYITPLTGFVRAEEADFTLHGKCCPLYFGRSLGNGQMEGAPEQWEDFRRRILQTLKSKEKIKLYYS